VPYLTPESIPEDDDCRPLSIPASTDWLAIVSGALTELTKSYNWEQQGAVTVDEAVARMQEMVDLYYLGCVDSCDIGEGLPPFRLGANGHIQQLVDGEWVEPIGDYTIPPVPARTEPTVAERKCLAAANAANVLALLYENVTDSFNEDKTLEEAVGALLAAIAAYFFWLAPIAAGLLLLALAAMEIVYLLVEFFGADLWTTEFTNVVRCMLYDCASDEGDVITFDYDCFIEKLNTTLSHPDLDAAQLRLLIQIGYLLSVIGGADALNHAGATTGVTEAECDACATWCWAQRLDIDGLGEWTLNWGDLTPDEGVVGVFQSGAGYRSSVSWVATHELQQTGVYWGEGCGGAVNIYLVNDDLSTVLWSAGGGCFDEGIFYANTHVEVGTNLRWEIQCSTNPLDLIAPIVGGNGFNPYGEDNCPECVTP